MHIVISGGSRGIGSAAVSYFASLGHKVTFFYCSSQEKAKALAQETGATAMQVDVADGKAVERAFSAMEDVDVVICNAGISHMGLFSMMEESQWDRLFDVNVKGVYHCAKFAMPFFLQKQKGCILTVSSMWGQVGASCEVAYSASKGAVIAMTKALAKELGPSHIRVNCICPGVIETDMVTHLGQETLDELREETPLETLGKPMDVVKAMEYLISAEFVTGQVFGVNGGMVI